MAANNGGGGGRQGNNQMNEHVEFSVKAEEDLYLTGSENTIRRVTAETNYSCLMLKTQRFSSLFRHYAKYHGLRKDDLEYYFVNLLENEDTPESVQLQRGDTIMVRKRRKPEPPAVAADDDEFYKDLRDLLDDEEHMDCIIKVHSSSFVGTTKGVDLEDMEEGNGDWVEIRAHRAVLTARGEYFKAAFRTHGGNQNAGFAEAKECLLTVEPRFTEKQVRLALEFLYTNRIPSLRELDTESLVGLAHLAETWLLRDLKRLLEHELIRAHLSVSSVARLYGAAEEMQAKRLSRACIEFIMANLRQLAGNADFEEEMKNYPHLCIPVLKAAANLIPEGPVHKKQRTDHHHLHGSTPSSAAGMPSPAVPDSDP